MSSVDGRGSEPQRILFNMLKQHIYPSLDIHYEYLLPDLSNQRIDIFIPSLALALEYNGEQHYHYIEFFHKNFEDYLYQLKLEKRKEEYLYDHGIKLITIPYDKMVNSPQELKKLIDETPYPEVEYSPLLSKEVLDNKPFKESEEKRKERLLKEKLIRKERYRKEKERRKKEKGD